MELKVAPELKERVNTIAKEMNAFISKGKWELFNDEAQQFIDKWGLNELFMMGCKLHKLPTTSYLELPYHELKEKDITSILFTMSKLMAE